MRLLNSIWKGELKHIAQLLQLCANDQKVKSQDAALSDYRTSALRN